MKAAPELFNTNEVAEVVGCTIRDLQYWDDIALLCPARGRLNAREYTIPQIRRAHVIKALRDRRVTHAVILEVFGGVEMDTDFGVYQPACHTRVAWSAAKFTKLADKDAVIEFLKGTRGPSYLIGLNEL